MADKDLVIMAVINHGDYKTEYVRLRVLNDVNLQDFVIVDKTFGEDRKLSNIHRHVYKFPDFEVNEGDFIRVYTKKGKQTVTYTVTGHPEIPVHHFFMGLEEGIWNNEIADSAELWKIQIIDKMKVPTVKS